MKILVGAGLLLVGALGSACSMTSGVRGVTLASTPLASAPYTPLAAAEIRIECPGTAPRTTRSDEAGRFFIELDEEIPNACVVRAIKPGYREVRRRLGDVCARHVRIGEKCDAASFIAELASESAGAAPAEPLPAASPAAAPQGVAQ